MSNNLNSVIVEGLIRGESIEKTTPNYACFSVEVKREYKIDGEIITEVSVFDIEAFGKLAESVKKYLDNGAKVRVVGRLTQKVYELSDGKRRAKVIIIAEHIELAQKIKEGKND